MANLTSAAKQARIAAYRDGLKLKLANRLIDAKNVAFTDLIADKNPNKPMNSLNGDIILERDLTVDGSLKGVVSVHPDALAAMLPDIKADTTDKMGWKKHLDKFNLEGKDILVGVADPQPTEYDTSAAEDLLALSLDPISPVDIKDKLKAIQDKVKAGNIQ